MSVAQRSLAAVRRAPRPDARLDVLGVLAAGAAAAVAYVLALSLQVLPPTGFAVVLFSAVPLLAALALPVYAVRARTDGDVPLAWFATGLAVALVAMVLQLVSFPAVSAGGGPLGTGSIGNSQLYLIFHAAPAAGAIAGALHLAPRWRRWVLAAGVGLALAAAVNRLPSPPLLRADLSFTPVLVASEVVLAVVLAAATLLWIARVGRAARPLRGWAALSLSLGGYDVVLNAVAAQRYEPVWWASLSLRVATYAVLAGGGVTSTLTHLGRLERYTDQELDRSDRRLSRSLQVTDRLLASAEALSSAVTVRDVCDVIVAAAREATGLPRAEVLVAEESGRLGGASSRRSAWQEALDRRVPRYRPSPQAVRADGPADDAGHVCLAVLPLLSAGSAVGLLVVSGDQPREWTATDRELLGGLSAQAAPALERAVLFERQRSAAELLQRGLLPRRLVDVPGVAMAARYLPGTGGRVGGDWYDCLPLPGGRVALVVGDVMGKGLPAAARMGQIRHAVRVLASIDPSPSAVLAGLDHLPDEMADDWIVTMVYVLLDPATGTGRIARAGHLPPVLVHPDGAAELVETGGSVPLGVTGQGRHEAAIRLPARGTLLLYTDGLVEDRRTGLERGLPELVEAAGRLVAGLPDGTDGQDGTDGDGVDHLADDLLAALPRSPGQDDDTCLLVVRLTGGLAAERVWSPLTGFVLEPGPLAPRTARAQVLEALDAGGIPATADDRDTLCLLCSELVTNAVLHSRRNLGVRVSRAGDRVRLEVHDGSAAMPVRAPHQPQEESGRGLVLVSALADDWGAELDEHGKTVWVELALHGEDGTRGEVDGDG